MLKKFNWLFALSIFINIALITLFAVGRGPGQSQSDQQRFPLLSKRLFVENPNDIIVNFAPLRTDVRDYLEKTKIPYSFYMEYLPSGSSIRAGETEEFIGASLMKIPVIMDVYKAYELKKLDPEQKITITDPAISNKFGKLYQAGSGAQVSLQEAVKLAIKESDNTAARLLLLEVEKVLDPRERSLNFLDVGLSESTVNGQSTILISARSYSSFFRCLYLSCYLNYGHSQEILDLLTQTDFHSRMEAGVSDKSIKVAHKIGTFSEMVSSDCGIVYVPNRPYMFCLMFKSTAIDVDKHIAEVSKMVYEYVTKANAGNQ